VIQAKLGKSLQFTGCNGRDLARKHIVVNIQVTKDRTAAIVAWDRSSQGVFIKVQNLGSGNVEDATRKSACELVLGKVDKFERFKCVKGISNRTNKLVVIDSQVFWK
jgi:hypothetical protein